MRLDSGDDLSFRLPSNHAGRALMKSPGEPITLSLHPEDTVIVPEAD